MVNLFLMLHVVSIVVSSSVKSREPVAIILARGGSKGIKLKNLQFVGHMNLLEKAINTAKVSEFKRIVVCTDHPYIALEALKHGADLFKRSQITATDYAPSIWAVAEFLLSNNDVESIALIQTTSPFLTPNSLRQARTLFSRSNVDCVFSVWRTHKLHWKEEYGKIKPRNFDLGMRPRRQSWAGELVEAGSFYFTKKNLIIKGYFQNDNCAVVEVDKMEAFEIDDISDLILANLIIKENIHNKRTYD